MSAVPRIAVVLASGLLLLGVTAHPAQSAVRTYVALGDSYSSGTGTRTYLDDGTSCQRSVYAYPSLIAGSTGAALNLRACSGATIADVTTLQLSALDTGTTYVSITVGGNDAGFASVLTECAKPAWASNCNRAVDRAQSVIDNQIPARLDTLFSGIRGRAPQARTVVAGYPRIFNGEDCNLFTWFSPTEEARLNATADRLNTQVQSAAGRAGLTYRNPTPAFVGHAVCDSPEWLNGLSNPTGESFHPNRVGHASGYAPLVGPALTGSSVAVRRLSKQAVADLSTRLATQQRRYAAQDRTIRPQPFTVPDLDSPQIRKAAARAGVDLRSRRSIDRTDATYAARQAKAFSRR